MDKEKIFTRIMNELRCFNLSDSDIDELGDFIFDILNYQSDGSSSDEGVEYERTVRQVNSGFVTPE